MRQDLLRGNDYNCCVVATFVCVHEFPSLAPKTGDPSSSPSTPKTETAQISYPDATSTSTTTTSTMMTVWFENDYFLYPKTSATTTSPTVRISRLRLLRLRTCTTTSSISATSPTSTTSAIFLHVPKTPALPRRPSFHVCTQTLKPLYLYALFSITCQLFYKMSYHHVALHLVGSGNSNIT